MTATPRAPMPFWALFVSIAVFAVPAVLTGLRPLPEGVTALSWLFVVIPIFFFAYFEGWRGVVLALAMWVVLLVLALMAGPLVGGPQPDWIFVGHLSVALLVNAIAIAWLAASLHRDLGVTALRERTMAEQLALRDELTGLPNLKYAKLYLDSSFAAAERGFPLTIVLLDVDRLKDYNEFHGRGVSDGVLRAVGHVLGRTTRKMELSARLDGGRFVSILNTRDPAAALRFVRRLRNALLELDLPVGRVTVSAGVAPFGFGMRASEDLLRAAESALGKAKNAGRDSESVYSPSAEATASQKA